MNTVTQKMLSRQSLIKYAEKHGVTKAKTEWMSIIDKLQKNVGRANFNITKQEREMLLEVETIIPSLKV